MNHDASEPSAPDIDSAEESGSNDDVTGHPDQARGDRTPGHGPSSGMEHHRTGSPEGDGSAPLDAEFVDSETGEPIRHGIVAVSRSGPLPTVSEFRGYEEVVPGAAERILQLAELSTRAAANATAANAEATRAEADASRAGAESVRQDAVAIKRGQYIFAGLFGVCVVVAFILALTGNSAIAVAPLVLAGITGCGILVRPVNPSRWRGESARE